MDSLTLLPLLFLFLLSPSTTSSAANLCAHSRRSPNDLSIFHIASKCTPFSTPPSRSSSELDSVRASAKQDPARVAYLISLSKIPVASGLNFMQTNNYVLLAKLGSPGQQLFLALDTGSDASWVPCAGCVGCPSSNASFTPAKSTTYMAIDCASSMCPQFKGLACATTAGAASSCGFNMTYGGDSFSATLSQDSLRLGHDVVPSYPFGCMNSVASSGDFLPKQGLLGLGRGPTGFLAQSGSLYQGVFSYCLPSFRSNYFSGSLRLGPVGQRKSIRTTPLLLNPHRPSLYYVGLTGVSVGKVKVAVPLGSFDFDPQTGAGTIVDCGTVITRFVSPAYAAIRDEFRSQVNATSYSTLGAFDTCFETNGDQPGIPAVTLHMTELDLTLPAQNTVIHSSSRPLACLAMAAAPDNVNSVVNVIASYQQQNLRVLVDVANSKLGFASELCS